jgi:hypothetical protein
MSEDKRVGVADCGHGLPESPGGQKSGVKKRLTRIDGYHAKRSRETMSLLEPVIQYKHFRFQPPHRKSTSGKAIPTHNNGHTPQHSREHPRLVARLCCANQDSFPVTDDGRILTT